MLDLFGEVGGQITPGAIKRAHTVIDHWMEMATNGVRREKGEFFGDILNPLANRVHDSLWEMGDGNVVLHLVEQKLIEEPALAKLAFNNDVKRYVPSKLLVMANIIMMDEQTDYIGSDKVKFFRDRSESLYDLIRSHLAWDNTFERTYVSGSSYYGSVIDKNESYVLQHTGKGIFVAHDIQKLDTFVTKDQKMTVKYEQGRGYVSLDQEMSKKRVLAR